MTKPTKEEIETAKKVLQYYIPIADKVSLETDQSEPNDWSIGASVWLGLLEMNDPEQYMQDYLDSYNSEEGEIEEEGDE